MPRLTPVQPEAMSDEQRALYEAILGGKRGPGMRGEDGALIGPFNAMLLNPHVGDRVQRLGEALRFDISLSRNVIEVATLVVGNHWRAQFEWWAHEPGQTGRRFGSGHRGDQARRAPRFQQRRRSRSL